MKYLRCKFRSLFSLWSLLLLLLVPSLVQAECTDAVPCDVLMLKRSHTPHSNVVPGGAVVFTVEMFNNDAANAYALALKETVDSRLGTPRITQNPDNRCQVSGQTIRCEWDAANPFAAASQKTLSYSVDVPVDATDGAIFSNSALFSANGSSSLVAKTAADSVAVGAMGFTYTATASAVTDGGEVIYDLMVLNATPEEKRNIKVVNTLAAGIEFSSAHIYVSSGYVTRSPANASRSEITTVNWTINALSAGDSAHMQVVGKLYKPAAATSAALTNVATLSVGGVAGGEQSLTVRVLGLPFIHYSFDKEEVGSLRSGSSNQVINNMSTSAFRGTLRSNSGTEAGTSSNIVGLDDNNRLLLPDNTTVPATPTKEGSFCNAMYFDEKARIVVGGTDENFRVGGDKNEKKGFSSTAWVYWFPKSGKSFSSIFSNDANFEFHVRDDNAYKGQINWWARLRNITDSAGAGTMDTFTKNQSGKVPEKTWAHIAVVHNPYAVKAADRQIIYINGERADLQFNNAKEISILFQSNACKSFNIGSDVITETCAVDTNRNFHGLIDEVKVYEFALTPEEILLDKDYGRVCEGRFYDHIEVVLPDAMDSCSPAQIEFRACKDGVNGNALCSSLYLGEVTVHVSAGNEARWVDSQGEVSETLSVALGHGSHYVDPSRMSVPKAGSSTELAVVVASPRAANGFVCKNKAGETRDCVLPVKSGNCSFDAAEVSDCAENSSCKPNRGETRRLYTRIADKSETFAVLRVLDKMRNQSFRTLAGSVLNPKDQSRVVVDLVDAEKCTDFDNCAAIKTEPVNWLLAFEDADKGRKTVSFRSAQQAVQQAKVRLCHKKYDATAQTLGVAMEDCALSSDSFALRPADLRVESSVNNSELTGAPAVPAGQSVTVKLRPYGWQTDSSARVVNGYTGSSPEMTIDVDKAYLFNGENAKKTPLEHHNNIDYDFSIAQQDEQGEYRDGRVIVRDVGRIELLKDAIIDKQFTHVDANNGDCTPESADASLTPPGCWIGTQAAKLGRFYPNHFSYRAQMQRPVGTAEQGFVYYGQPFAATFTFKAHARDCELDKVNADDGSSRLITVCGVAKNELPDGATYTAGEDDPVTEGYNRVIEDNGEIKVVNQQMAFATVALAALRGADMTAAPTEEGGEVHNLFADSQLTDQPSAQESLSWFTGASSQSMDWRNGTMVFTGRAKANGTEGQIRYRRPLNASAPTEPQVVAIKGAVADNADLQAVSAPLVYACGQFGSPACAESGAGAGANQNAWYLPLYFGRLRLGSFLHYNTESAEGYVGFLKNGMKIDLQRWQDKHWENVNELDKTSHAVLDSADGQGYFSLRENCDPTQSIFGAEITDNVGQCFKLLNVKQTVSADGTVMVGAVEKRRLYIQPLSSKQTSAEICLRLGTGNGGAAMPWLQAKWRGAHQHYQNNPCAETHFRLYFGDEREQIIYHTEF